MSSPSVSGGEFPEFTASGLTVTGQLSHGGHERTGTHLALEVLGGGVELLLE